MATRKGLWDETLVLDGWFSYSQQVEGWFNPDDLDEAAASNEGAGQVTGVGVLTGAGRATEGTGDVLGIGLLTGTGQPAEGTGDVFGIGALSGAGQAAEGYGSVTGIGFLQGEGDVPAASNEGGGGVSGVGYLSGTGEAEQSATATTGGGRSKRKGRRYPRRVMLRGHLYTVKSWDEELNLLQAAVDRAEYRAAVEPEIEQPIPVLKRRLKKVESERDRWLADLRQRDEEIILFLM